MIEFNADINWFKVFFDLFDKGVFLYSFIIISTYIVLANLSIVASVAYLRKNSFVNYRSILTSPLAPSVSIIAPAYNEGFTIVDNVRSLMSVHYPNFDVILINDGSKDDTLEKLIEEYNLVQVDFSVDYKIKTKKVKGVYKSSNSAFKSLLVVDKINGGKADALNVGINISDKDYVACIDVDCVLEQDALLKLMKPILEQTDKEVIATGGVIRIANSCIIEDGRLIGVKVPDNWIARIQVMEYIRAFLLGRMAWNYFDGLLIISGALGVFNKKIVIEVGGYDHDTVGEDMELIVRMRRYMCDENRPYSVAFIPDPLCWTEAPDSWQILYRQRNRWTRGTIETILIHKKLFLNPKYGIIGVLSFPYWVIFEWFAPVLEGLGLFLFFFFAIIGLINWYHFGLLLCFIYCFAVMFSVWALFIEEITYHQYKKSSDILKLLIISMLEPFFYHPFNVYCSIRGNIDFITGKSNWGEMTRKGFKAE